MSIKKIRKKINFTSLVCFFDRPKFEFEKFEILDEKLSFECKVAWKWLVPVSGDILGWTKRWNKIFQNSAIFLAILGHFGPFFWKFYKKFDRLKFSHNFSFCSYFSLFTNFWWFFANFGQKFEFWPKLLMKNYLLNGKAHENG